MKFYIAVLTFLTLFVLGCSSSSPGNQQNNTGQTAQAPAETKPATPSLGPTDTLKALSDASKKKDVEAIKKHLSQGTLALLETGAQEQKKSVDQILKEKDGAPFPKLPELGAEQVEGETATLEVKNTESGKFEKLPFVKENGEWKVAIDVYLNNLDAEVAQEPPKP